MSHTRSYKMTSLHSFDKQYLSTVSRGGTYQRDACQESRVSVIVGWMFEKAKKLALQHVTSMEFVWSGECDNLTAAQVANQVSASKFEMIDESTWKFYVSWGERPDPVDNFNRKQVEYDMLKACYKAKKGQNIPCELVLEQLKCPSYVNVKPDGFYFAGRKLRYYKKFEDSYAFDEECNYADISPRFMIYISSNKIKIN